MKMISGGMQFKVGDACKRRYESFVDWLVNYIGKPHTLLLRSKSIIRIWGVVRKKISALLFV